MFHASRKEYVCAKQTVLLCNCDCTCYCDGSEIDDDSYTTCKDYGDLLSFNFLCFRL